MNILWKISNSFTSVESKIPENTSDFTKQVDFSWLLSCLQIETYATD